MELLPHTRDLYCQTSERVESDTFSAKRRSCTCVRTSKSTKSVRSTRFNEFKRTAHPLINYSSTYVSDEESERHPSNGDRADDEDIPSDDDHQACQMVQQTLRVSDNISSIDEQNKYNKNNNLIIIIFNLF